MARERAQRLLEGWFVEGRVDGGQLEMLVRAGILDEDEADRWRRAIRHATASPAPADPGFAARVEEAIEHMAPPARFGALGLAAALGVIDEHEVARRQLELLDTWDGPEDGEVPDVGVGWTTFVPLPDDLVPGERDELGLAWPAPAEDPTGAPVRVLPGPPDRRDGVRVTSIAVHEHRTVVRWHAPRPIDPDTLDVAGDRWPIDARLELRDDVGTDYKGHGARSIGSGGRVSGVAEFAPSVPPDARVLYLTWGGGTSSCDAVSQ